MKKINKYIVIAFVLFLVGCTTDPCGFSDMCYMNREIERVRNLTDEERAKEKKMCRTLPTYDR